MFKYDEAIATDVITAILTALLGVSLLAYTDYIDG